jgi:molybdate transport system substrate-binding protein
MNVLRALLLAVAVLFASAAAHAEPVVIAAASSLRFALDAILADHASRPDAARTRVVYGSSGKLVTQIAHGAPFDLLLAADIEHPQRLLDAGHAIAPLHPFARGRLVLWSLREVPPTLAGIADTSFKRIAIASPQHAPYGRMASARSRRWARPASSKPSTRVSSMGRTSARRHRWSTAARPMPG